MLTTEEALCTHPRLFPVIGLNYSRRLLSEFILWRYFQFSMRNLERFLSLPFFLSLSFSLRRGTSSVSLHMITSIYRQGLGHPPHTMHESTA